MKLGMKLVAIFGALMFLFPSLLAHAQASTTKRIGWFFLTIHKDQVTTVKSNIQNDPRFIDSECVEMAAQPGFGAREYRYGPKKNYKEIGYECSNLYEDTFIPFTLASFDYSGAPGKVVELRFYSMGFDPDGTQPCQLHYCGWPKNAHPPGWCGACPH
jgi:hypothetical protein